jgi:dTDP-4-dehydrorhamnose reductase
MDRERGIWHLASSGAATWADLAREAVRGAALDSRKVLAVPNMELDWSARRPAQSALGSRRGALMPPLEAALARYLDTLKAPATDISTGSFLTRYRPPG